MEMENANPVMTDRDLNIFRTKRCAKHEMHGICSNKLCFDAHCNRNERDDTGCIRPNTNRRPPFANIQTRELRYMNILCNNVTVNVASNVVDNSNCELGLECPYCHTWDEYLFHPMNYKTMMCPKRHGGPHCDDVFCPGFHTLEDISQRSKARWMIKVRKDTPLAEVPSNIEVIQITPIKKGRAGLIDGILHKRKHRPPQNNAARRASVYEQYDNRRASDNDFTQSMLMPLTQEAPDELRLTYRAPENTSEAATRNASYAPQEYKDVVDSKEEDKYIAKNETPPSILSPCSATTIGNSPSCASMFST